MKANEKKTPSMTAQEYMDTLEMATELQCLLPVRNTWESMGVIMEGWCRGQNPRDIIELAKCGRNELQIMGSIYRETVQQDLQEAMEARAAKQMIRALQAAGTTTEELAEGITGAWRALDEEAQRQARERREALEARHTEDRT